jgi:hypothetical protein
MTQILWKGKAPVQVMKDDVLTEGLKVTKVAGILENISIDPESIVDLTNEAAAKLKRMYPENVKILSKTEEKKDAKEKEGPQPPDSEKPKTEDGKPEKEDKPKGKKGK